MATTSDKFVVDHLIGMPRDLVKLPEVGVGTRSGDNLLEMGTSEIDGAS